MFNNIFTSYLYSKKLDINLTSLKKHILQTQRNDKEGVHLSNLGGWQSQGFKNPMPSNKSLFKSLDLIVKEIKDTVGAGDAFAGGFLYGINNGLDYEKSGKLASALSSKVVTKLGPRLEKNIIDNIKLSMR